MTLFNATDIPLEVRGKVLCAGRSIEVETPNEEELAAVKRGVLTDFWPAPVDHIAARFGPGVHQLQSILRRF